MEITLVDMDLYSGNFKHYNTAGERTTSNNGGTVLSFPSYYVACNPTPLLKEKTKLSVQLERNLHKDVRHDERVPDTRISGKLSSIFCRLDHTQYWLVRGILAYNIGEQIPDFPQPTASLQSPQTNTILTGAVKTTLKINFHLDNISIELLEDKLPHQLDGQQVSLGRLDFVQSHLNLVSNTMGERTTSLSCQSFSAHDVNAASDAPSSGSVFYTVLGPKEERSDRKIHFENTLQFELHHRIRTGCEEFTVLLNNMRVYLILSWLKKIQNYLLFNPNDGNVEEEKKDVEKKTKVHKQPQYQDEGPIDGRRKEFTLCFSDTEFVIPEKLNKFDTNAIILRATSVLHFIPDNTLITGTGHLPLRCSLERLEMFSCQLDKEKLTELSIIDPVTINVEVRKMRNADLSAAELAADQAILKKNILDVQVTEFNMRFSYNDLILIRAFATSVQEQLTTETANLHGSSAVSAMTSQQQEKMERNYFLSESALSRLTELGYERKDAIYAMTLNTGNISHATAWLINHAKVRPSDDAIATEELDSDLEELGEKRHPPLNLIRLNAVIDAVKICLIDDCANDCDAPLAEISCQKFHLRQGFASAVAQSMQSWIFNQHGSASFRLKCDYYNRMLSLWEPFLEPWRCNISWKHVQPTSIYRATSDSPANLGDWSLKVEGSDKFDLNVTTPLMDTAFMTYDRWMTHYQKTKQQQQNRQPFVPYVIRNLTGTVISFATQTAVSIHDYDVTMASQTRSFTNKPNDPSVWSDLLPGDEKNFNYNQNHEKQRHKRAAVLKLHQIVVKVKGWKIAEPVTVSKVGTYFRHTTREGKNYHSQCLMRMVFGISLEASGKKIITVRSALAIKSRVKIPLELRLEGAPNVGSQTLPVLLPDETIYVPLHLTSSALRLRPKNSNVFGSYQFCSSSIEWQNLQPSETRRSQLIECLSTSSSNNQPFHFAVSIQRGNYPSYKEVIDTMRRNEPAKPSNSNWLFSNEDEEETTYPRLPGHTIIIMPPVTISNLLPCDLRYYIKNTQVEGTLKPGMDATPHIVHILPTDKRSAASLHIGCLLENFQSCREIVIPFVVKDFQMRMIMKDLRDETLILNVRVLWKLKCSVRISIMAGYWIVNKTGLPLIVKQDGADRPAAGQYDVHEQARSLEPLLFSYSNREGSYLCTMRLGKKARIDEMTSANPALALATSSSSSSAATPSLVGRLRSRHQFASGQGIPSYCESFSTDGGTSTRNLKLITSDNTPNREFCIGISVRRGWGRYLHTHIVTVAPRFLLINKTSKHKLSFAQRHSISYVSDGTRSNYHLTIIPGSSVVFHWPRVDLDTLLCVKLADEPTCHWSGGFVIDRINAFHIALRIASNGFDGSASQLHPLAPHCVFLSVEVTLQQATYCITITEADPTLVPPPLRIDNMSAATITYKQVGTDNIFNTDVVAESQLAFACDEPCLPEQIQCAVKGGSLNVIMDMKNIGLEKQLCYENFIYIAIGPPQENRTMKDSIHSTPMRLVLDTSGSQSGDLHLQPLRAGKRSQLWRMTSDGRIFHEGSSPPDSSRDLRRSATNQGLVLDISEMAFNQKRPLTEGIPLALKPVDERRRSTQTWQFLQCGILSCRHKGLTVQVKSLEVGARPVLAHYKEGGVMLPTQMCSSHKLIPGSGMLSLKITRDGPTRVLKVLDIRQKRAETQDALMKNSFKMKSSGIAGGKPSPLASSKKKMLKLRPSTIPTNENMRKRKNASDFHLNCTVALPKGFGISLVSNFPEELIYICLCGVNVNVILTPDEQKFSLKIQKLQIDNQLIDAYPTVLLHPTHINCPNTKKVTTSRSSPRQKIRSTSIDLPAYLHGSMSTDEGLTGELSNKADPFISIRAVRQSSSTSLYEIYKFLIIKVDDMNMQIEERLLLKILQFIGLAAATSEKDHELFDEVKTDLYRAAAADEQMSTTKRFYFDHLSFSMAPLKLGVMTSSNLTDELKTIRSNFNFTLIQFQNAPVTIQPYSKRHMFETFSFIGKDFSKHLMDQLIGQAAKILGSVDFLGNPIGLLSDVKAGVTNLAKGNLPDMVLNLTHGLSNSTAKVASSLSNGLGGIVMDEDYGNKRRAIQANARNPGGHVVAGLQGLMAGMIGGLTSVITQPVKGAQMDGAAGFFKGIGKGLIGTVAKPVTGVLDFASGSASAVRDISTSSGEVIQRCRPIRCCHSFQGCLQSYSSVHAEGQQFLYALNRNNYGEYFYEMTEIKIRNEGILKVLITNKCVYIVKDGEADPDLIFLQVSYPDLLGIRVVHEGGEHGGTVHLIELSIKTAGGFGQIGYSSDGTPYNYSVKKPRVICHSQVLAESIRQQIEYAKMLSTEQLETLKSEISEEDEDRNFKLQV